MGREVTVASGYNSLSEGVYIPEVWSKKLQKKYYANTCKDDIFNSDWEGEIKGKGSKVIIRVKPSITTFDYEVGGTIPYQDLADDKIELLIDKAKGWAFKDDDIDTHQADIPFVNIATEEAGKQSGVDIEQAVFAVVYAQTHSDNIMSSTVVTKANVLDWLVDAKVLLQEKNVPNDGRRWALLPPWICGMIDKSELRNSAVAGDGKSSIFNPKGYVGTSLSGFKIYESNNISTSGGTYRCMAGHPDFCCFASQFVETQLKIILPNTFGYAHRGLNVHGYKVTKPEAGVYMPATKS